MSNNTTTSQVSSCVRPLPTGNTTYASYAICSKDGQYWPARSYPACLLGIYSEFDVEALLLVDNALVTFATYDEAKSFASQWQPAQGGFSLYLLSHGLAPWIEAQQQALAMMPETWPVVGRWDDGEEVA